VARVWRVWVRAVVASDALRGGLIASVRCLPSPRDERGLPRGYKKHPEIIIVIIMTCSCLLLTSLFTRAARPLFYFYATWLLLNGRSRCQQLFETQARPHGKFPEPALGGIGRREGEMGATASANGGCNFMSQSHSAARSEMTSVFRLRVLPSLGFSPWSQGSSQWHLHVMRVFDHTLSASKLAP